MVKEIKLHLKLSVDYFPLHLACFSLSLFFFVVCFSFQFQIGNLDFIDGRIVHKPLLSRMFSMEISVLQLNFFIGGANTFLDWLLNAN